MRICENCSALCEEEVCSKCGGKNIRQVQDTDFCFFLECSREFGNSFKEVLEKENIPCVLLPSGSGINTIYAVPLENYKVYVPYLNYERAINVYNYFINVPSLEEYKKTLLDNIDKWYIAEESTVKKIGKKFKIAKNADVFESIIEAVKNANRISNKGKVRFAMDKEGEGLLVEYGKISLWFNAETFEIIL